MQWAKGVCIQACNCSGCTPPQPINMRAVSILMECFLVNFAFVQCKWAFKLITSLNKKPDFHIKLECIPVGCIPPTAVAVMRGLHTPPWEQTPLPPGADTPWSRPPWVWAWSPLPPEADPLEGDTHPWSSPPPGWAWRPHPPPSRPDHSTSHH